MKLYSRMQVLVAMVSSLVLGGALTLGILNGLGVLGPKNPIEAPGSPTISGAVDSPLAQKIELSDELTPDEKQNISVYQNFNEAVVNITTEVVAYNWFLEPVPQSGGTGSGSIIDKRGYVLTNHHVVKDAVKVVITLFDGTQFDGEILGSDQENDLAVVKFDPKNRNLTTIPLGTSKGLRVGQKVLAIGNPFALDRTLTTGIISALGRPLKTESGLVIREMIQTDASINPGNSGGPLLNSKGQMVGINTMIFSPSGGSVGIGFAIPVETAKRVVPDLMQFGKVVRGWIDVIPVQLFPDLVRYARLNVSKGLLVSRVTEGGNAQAAGIKGGNRNQAVRYRDSVIYLGGDIITNVAGQTIESLSDLYGALESTKPGQKVKVTVQRGNQKLDLDLTLSQRPDKFQWE